MITSIHQSPIPISKLLSKQSERFITELTKIPRHDPSIRKNNYSGLAVDDLKNTVYIVQLVHHLSTENGEHSVFLEICSSVSRSNGTGEWISPVRGRRPHLFTRDVLSCLEKPGSFQCIGIRGLGNGHRI